MAELDLGKAQEWFKEQISATSGAAQDAWKSISSHVEEYYKSGKTLVVDKEGNVDLTGLKNWASAEVEAVKKNGAPIVEEAGNIANKNMFGLIGGGIAAVLAWFLDLGPIGTILSGLIGAAAGSFFGDKDNGFMNTAFNIKNTPAKQQTPEGTTPAITTPEQAAKIEKARGELVGELSKATPQEIAAAHDMPGIQKFKQVELNKKNGEIALIIGGWDNRDDKNNHPTTGTVLGNLDKEKHTFTITHFFVKDNQGKIESVAVEKPLILENVQFKQDGNIDENYLKDAIYSHPQPILKQMDEKYQAGKVEDMVQAPRVPKTIDRPGPALTA